MEVEKKGFRRGWDKRGNRRQDLYRLPVRYLRDGGAFKDKITLALGAKKPGGE